MAKSVALYQKVLGIQRNQVLIYMSWLPMDDADREMNVGFGDPKFLNDRRELDLTVKTTAFSILTMRKNIQYQ